jgi:Domain of unknown function (DUF2017)
VKFRRTGKGIVAAPDQVEATVLAQCVRDLVTLLGGPQEVEADPLAAMVGMPTGDPQTPDDPALARLLPDAYDDDDAAAASEFRRYTEDDLRAGKRAAAATVLATLPAGGGKLLLDREQADAWLGCLNDLRLVLGTRLEVTEDTEPDLIDDADPRRQALDVYGWLGWLQESLLRSLDPRL